MQQDGSSSSSNTPKPQAGTSLQPHDSSTPTPPTSSSSIPPRKATSQASKSGASASRMSAASADSSSPTLPSSDTTSRVRSATLQPSPVISDAVDPEHDLSEGQKKVKGKGAGNGRGATSVSSTNGADDSIRRKGHSASTSTAPDVSPMQALSSVATSVVSSSSAFASTSKSSASTASPSLSTHLKSTTQIPENDDGFARAQAMGLKLTREEFERSKAGLSAFLKAERAPTSSNKPGSSNFQASRSSPSLENRNGKFSRQNSRSSIVGDSSSSQSHSHNGATHSSSSSSSSSNTNDQANSKNYGFSAFASRPAKGKDPAPKLSFFTAVIPEEVVEPRVSMLESAGIAEEQKRAKEKIRKRLAKEREGAVAIASAARTPKLSADSSPSTSSIPRQRDTSMTYTPSSTLGKRGQLSSGSDVDSSRFESAMESSINGSGSGSSTGGSRSRMGLGFSGLDLSTPGDDVEESPSHFPSQISHRNRLLRERNESHQSSQLDATSPNPDSSTAQSNITNTPITSYKINGDDNDEVDELSLRANVSTNGILSLSDPSTVPERAALAKALAIEYQESFLNDAIDRMSLLDRVMETFTSPLRRRKEAKARERGEQSPTEHRVTEADATDVLEQQQQQSAKSVRWAEQAATSLGGSPSSLDTPNTSVSNQDSISKPSTFANHSSTSIASSARRHLTHARMSTRDHYDLMFHDLSPARGDLDVQEAIAHGGLPSDPSRPSGSPIWATSANVSGFRHRLGRGLMEAGMVDGSASQHLSPLSARAPTNGQLSLAGVERAGAALREISGDESSSRTKAYPVARGLLFSSSSPTRSIGEEDEAGEGDVEDTPRNLLIQSPGPSLTRSPVRRGFGPFDPSPIKLGRPLSFNASPRSGLLNRTHSTGSISNDRLRELSRDSFLTNSETSPSQPGGHHGRMRSSSKDDASLNTSQSRLPGPGWGKAVSQLANETISPAQLFGFENNPQKEQENPSIASSCGLSAKPLNRVDSASSSISLESVEKDQSKQDQEEEYLPVEKRQKSKSKKDRSKAQESVPAPQSNAALEKRKTPEAASVPGVFSGSKGYVKKPKEKKLVLGMADVTDEEVLLPDGSKRVRLVSDELRSAIRSGKLNPAPPPRYYVLPPHAGTSHEKPVDASYAGIIGAAILSSTNHVLSLAEIYSWITATYPFYKPGDHVWMNGVRYNLSSHDCFAKQNRDRQNPGKGGLWTIPDGFVGRFQGGHYVGRSGNSVSKFADAPTTVPPSSAAVDESRAASPSLSAAGSSSTEPKKKRGKQSQSQILAQAQAAQAQAVAQSSSIFNAGTFSRPRYQSPSTSVAPTPTPTSSHSKKSNDGGNSADTSSMLPPNSQSSNPSSNSRRRAHSTEVEDGGSQPNSPSSSRRKVAKRIKLVSRGNSAEAEIAIVAKQETRAGAGETQRPPLRTLSRNKVAGRSGAISASEDEQDLDDDAITPNRPGLSAYASSGHGSRGSRRVPMLTTAGSSPPSSPPDPMMPPPRSIGASGSVRRKAKEGMDEDLIYSSGRFSGKPGRSTASSGWAASPYGSPLVNRRGANITITNRLPSAVRTSTLLTSPQRLATNGNGSPYRLPYRSPISSLRGSVGMERGGSNGSKEDNKPSQLGNHRLLTASPIPASPRSTRAPMLTGSPIRALMSPAGARLQHALSGPNQIPASASSASRISSQAGNGQSSLASAMGLDSTPGRMTPNRWGAGLTGTPSPMRRFARSPINGSIGMGMGMGMSGLGGQFFDDTFDAQGNLDYELSFTDMTGLASIDQSPSRALYGSWSGNGGGNGGAS